jgi:glycosyltransferase involved in cell wall biosynthesis
MLFVLFLFFLTSIPLSVCDGRNSNESSGRGPSLLLDYHLYIEGWGATGISHSYSIVEKNLLDVMSNMKRSPLFTRPVVKHVHCPEFYGKKWKENEKCSNKYNNSNRIEKNKHHLKINLKFTFPFNFEKNEQDNDYDHTFVFATTEFYNTSKVLFAAKGGDMLKNHKITIITPSLWSKNGFLNGMKHVANNNIEILPHGIDTNIFKPVLMGKNRRHIRTVYFKTLFDLSDTNVIDDTTMIFLSVGAMTWNKGIDLLLNAYVKLYNESYINMKLKNGKDRNSQKYLLVLKGNDALYESKLLFLNALKNIPGAMALYEKKWIVYYGTELTKIEMSRMYSGADVYVSPYRAEAFNIPIFEAIASGLLVIVTDYHDEVNQVSSPTHKWLDDSFAMKVRSDLIRLTSYGNPYSYCFEPDVDDLYNKMKLSASSNNLNLRLHAKIVGPQYIKSYLTWDIIANRFLNIIDNKLYPKPFVRIEKPENNMVYTRHEAIAQDGINVKIVVGFGSDNYHHQNRNDIQWNLCIWSEKISRETFYAVKTEKQEDRSHISLDKTCQTIVKKQNGIDTNHVVNEKNDALKFEFQYGAQYGDGSYNIYVELNENNKRIVQKHVVMHVLSASKESEIYALNLIESGYYNIGKLYYAKNLKLSLPRNRQTLMDYNMYLNDENIISFVKYLMLIQPIMNEENVDQLYNTYIDHLQILNEYTSNNILNLDILTRYPAIDERKSFQEKIGKDCESSILVNLYLLLPNVFLSYYRSFDSDKFINAVHTLMKGWISSSMLLHPNQSSIIAIQSGKEETKRIGFFSMTLYTHSVGKLMIGTIRELSFVQQKENFIIYIFMPNRLLRQANVDVIVQHLKTFTVQIVPLESTKIIDASTIIKQLKLDVLIYTDLGTDPFSYTMSYMRLASIQVAFWGNPIIPDSNEIDYFMISEFHSYDQDHHQKNKNTPQIVCLNGLGSFAFRPALMSVRNEAMLSWNKRLLLSNENSTNKDVENIKILLVTQALCKIHPKFDRALRSILLMDVNAHVVVLAGLGPVWAGRLNIRFRRLYDQFADGIRWIDRIHILQRLPPDLYASIIQSSFLMLNTFPYSGLTTSLEAFSLKLPVVTLKGNSPRSSQTTMLYRNMKYEGSSNVWAECCIANDVDEYVNKTLYMLSNKSYRDKIADDISKNVNQLFKQNEAIESWVAFLRRVI